MQNKRIFFKLKRNKMKTVIKLQENICMTLKEMFNFNK